MVKGGIKQYNQRPIGYKIAESGIGVARGLYRKAVGSFIFLKTYMRPHNAHWILAEVLHE